MGSLGGQTVALAGSADCPSCLPVATMGVCGQSGRACGNQDYCRSEPMVGLHKFGVPIKMILSEDRLPPPLGHSGINKTTHHPGREGIEIYTSRRRPSG